jgi:hypothetical protein
LPFFADGRTTPPNQLSLTKETNMFRKSLLALAAAGTLALGMTSLSNTASADVHFGFGIGTGFGYHPGFYHHGYGWRRHYVYGPRCGWRDVRVRRHHHWVWRQVRVCSSFRGY